MAKLNMKSKHLFIVWLTVLGIGAIGLFTQQSKNKPAATLTVASRTTHDSPTVMPETTTPLAPEIVRAETPVAAEAVTTNLPPTVQLTKSGKPKHEKPPIQDPEARAALGWVGADPDAEQYWEAAINDPTLPAEDRKDLIEDLNEDGLSDTKHPGPQDGPLILNRLRLIEELSPNSIDAVNANAFAEAYKDLNNMLAGEPVK